MLSTRNLLTLTGVGALLAIVVLFVGVVTQAGDDGALPAADAQPTVATTTSTPTTTTATTTTPTTPTTSTTTSPASTSATSTAAASATTDQRGFVDSAARCDEGQTAVAVGSTQRSRVVVCAVPGGGYEYRGERISDGASLSVDAESTDDGTFVAENGAATYTVSATELKVVAGDTVIYRDTWSTFEARRG